jgi:ketosteroid isomerase-like protein
MFTRRTVVVAAFATVATLALLPPPSLVLGPGEEMPAPAMFEELERQLMTAVVKRNADVLERLIADDYELTSPDVSAERIGKLAFVQAALSPTGVSIEQFEFASVKATVLSKDAAIVRAELVWSSTGLPATMPRRFFLTDLWERQRGGWQLVSRHSTEAR